MKDESKLSLASPDFKNYVNQYGGHQRFHRLFSIIDKAHNGKVNDKLLNDSILYGYELAGSERVLGMFQKMQL